MSYTSINFYSKKKIIRGGFEPVLYHVCRRESVKGHIYLNAIKKIRIMLQVVSRTYISIEKVSPVLIAPPATSKPYLSHNMQLSV